MGLYQDSALSPFLFILDTLSERFREGIPWDLLFVDELVIIAESEEELQKNWLKYQRSLKKHSLKVNITKTTVMVRRKEKVSAKFVDCNNLELEQLHYTK